MYENPYLVGKNSNKSGLELITDLSHRNSKRSELPIYLHKAKKKLTCDNWFVITVAKGFDLFEIIYLIK